VAFVSIPRRAAATIGLILGGTAGAVALALGLLKTLARQAARRNTVVLRPPYRVDDATRRLHDQLIVADLHADSLLWRRDLRRRGSTGHVDLPRLREAGVALQVFSAVTRVPLMLNVERNAGRHDVITLLAIAQNWPRRTWGSRLERALLAAERLHRIAAAEQGRLMIVRQGADVEALLTRRRADHTVVGALLAIEGSHALDGDLDNLDVLHEAGFRMIGLQHFSDNEAGGSAHGPGQGGLTAFGAELVRRMQARRMIVDVAHSSPAVVSGVLAISTAPVVASHTGLRGTCDNQRNLSDEHVRGIAATGGLVGIALFAHAVGGQTVDDTARAIRYGADLAGVRHVALGSDFDGFVTTPTDVTGLPLLTAALRRQGFGDDEIAAIMGGNVLRLLRETL
jgi:microsomal dipeptidase-like Zn-dependent dipeptidase